MAYDNNGCVILLQSCSRENIFVPNLQMFHDNLNHIYFLASGDFCRLLITFSNSKDPDQDRQNLGPGLIQPVCPFDTLIVFQIFFLILNF